MKQVILAKGEVTGHYHEAIGFDVSLENNLFLAPHGALVKHQEHHEFEVPPGEYDCLIVREYDHFAEEARNIVD